MKKLINNIIQKEKKNFDKKLFLKILLFTIIIGLIIHGYGYLNPVPNHDSLTAFNQTGDVLWKIQIGRFMQAFSIYLRGYIPVPWITGLLSLIYMGLANYFLIKTISIKNKLHISLLISILISSITFTATNLIYYHENDAFMLAYLFSILSVYTFKNYKYGYIISALLIIVSCGFYQAYLSVSIILFLYLILQKILKKEQIKQIIVYGLKAIGVIAAGAILYYVAQAIFLNIFNLENIDSYNSIKNSHNMFSSLLPNFLHTYLSYGNSLLIPNDLYSIINIIANSILFIISLVYLIAYVKKNKLTKFHITLMLIIFILIPPAACSMYILSSGLLHVLMIFAIYLSYIFIFYILEINKVNKTVTYVTYTCFITIIFFNFIYANSMYYVREIIELRTYSIMSQIQEDIYNHDQFIPNKTEIVYIGDINTHINEEINYKYSAYILTYPLTYSLYNKHILSNDFIINFDENIINKYSAMENMVSYPNQGYITYDENKLIIKLN